MKKAFTMAELIITMALIGVLATILMTFVRSAKPNQEMLLFKKAYFLTNRIVHELNQDEDLFPTNRGGLDDRSAVYYHGKRYEGDTKFCELFATRLDVNSNVTCHNNDGVFDFTTSDNMQWSIVNQGNSFLITIDVNGDSKGNNTSSANCHVTPVDTFRIFVSSEGEVTPADRLSQAYIDSIDGAISYEELTEKLGICNGGNLHRPRP